MTEVPEEACSEVLAPPSSTSLLDLLAEPVDCGASALLDVVGALVETPLDASTFCLTGRDYSASTALLLTAPTGEGPLSPVVPPAAVDSSPDGAAPAEDTVTGSRHLPFSGNTEAPTRVPAVPVPPTAASAHGGCGGAGPRRDDAQRGSADSAVLPAAIPALAPPPVELRPVPTEVAPIVPRAEGPGVRPD